MSFCVEKIIILKVGTLKSVEAYRPSIGLGLVLQTWIHLEKDQVIYLKNI